MLFQEINTLIVLIKSEIVKTLYSAGFHFCSDKKFKFALIDFKNEFITPLQKKNKLITHNYLNTNIVKY